MARCLPKLRLETVGRLKPFCQLLCVILRGKQHRSEPGERGETEEGDDGLRLPLFRSPQTPKPRRLSTAGNEIQIPLGVLHQPPRSIQSSSFDSLELPPPPPFASHSRHNVDRTDHHESVVRRGRGQLAPTLVPRAHARSVPRTRQGELASGRRMLLEKGELTTPSASLRLASLVARGRSNVSLSWLQSVRNRS